MKTESIIEMIDNVKHEIEELQSIEEDYSIADQTISSAVSAIEKFNNDYDKLKIEENDSLNDYLELVDEFIDKLNEIFWAEF